MDVAHGQLIRLMRELLSQKAILLMIQMLIAMASGHFIMATSLTNVTTTLVTSGPILKAPPLATMQMLEH